MNDNIYIQQALKGLVKGKRILDIGGYDGHQAKWCLDHGARSAICVDNGEYQFYDNWKAKRLPGVSYIYQDFYQYNHMADVVIFQNVLYHQNNPWLAMEKIRSLTKEVMILCTSIIPGKEEIWRIYKPYEGHPVSWTVAWRPTVNGLLTLLDNVGFKSEIIEQDEGSIVVRCKCS